MAGPRDLGLTIVHRQDWCKLTQKDVINVTKNSEWAAAITGGAVRPELLVVVLMQI